MTIATQTVRTGALAPAPQNPFGLAIAGIAGVVYGRRRVKETAENLKPVAVARNVAGKVRDRLDDVVEAVREGREAMHDKELELQARRDGGAEGTEVVSVEPGRVVVLRSVQDRLPRRRRRIDDPAEIARTYDQQCRLVFNVTGTPAISVPTGLAASGVPLAMQIAGRAFDEPTIYRIAQAYCEAAGTCIDADPKTQPRLVTAPSSTAK